MYDRTIAIYCFVDDLLKAMQHSEDSRCEFSDAEVVTTAIVAMLFFGGNFERARSFLHSSGMMPRMLSRSRLSRRLSRLSDLIDVVFHQLGLTLKELNLESRYSLDSFPVAMCDFHSPQSFSIGARHTVSRLPGEQKALLLWGASTSGRHSRRLPRRVFDPSRQPLRY